MPKFEVAIFNREVRAKVREGDHHRDLDDRWADTHYITVTADDEIAARTSAESRYPPDRGYVIEAVDPALD